jgi:hypothetical protein
MARIELEHATKGLGLGNRKLSHLPPGTTRFTAWRDALIPENGTAPIAAN